MNTEAAAAWQSYQAHGPDEASRRCRECGKRWPCDGFAAALRDVADSVYNRPSRKTSGDKAG